MIAGRRIVSRQAGNGAAGQVPDRWHSVTVNRPPEEVAPEGRLPEPLAAPGRRRRGPGAPGSGRSRHRAGRPAAQRDCPVGLGGIAARAAGNDPRQQVRSALRQSKQLLETGEVLSPDEPSTTRRTLRSLPLELATRRAGGEGRL